MPLAEKSSRGDGKILGEIWLRHSPTPFWTKIVEKENNDDDVDFR